MITRTTSTTVHMDTFKATVRVYIYVAVMPDANSPTVLASQAWLPQKTLPRRDPTVRASPEA